MKTIIVPTDFSETANNALKAAVNLQKKHGCKLVLLHMLEIAENLLPELSFNNDVKPRSGTASNSLPDAFFYMKLAQKRFAEIRELPFLKGVEFEEAIQNYLNFKGIIDSAHKHEADLIVMGSQGSSGLSEMFLGSNTEKVVRYSDIPVLVVKGDAEKIKFENIVFASDFSEEAITPFIKANTLIKKLGAKLNLLYVNTPGDYFLSSAQMRKKIDTFLDTTKCKNDVANIAFVSDFTVEKGVLNYATDNKMDAISVATHGRTGISHFFSGSISEDIANHANKPVITFKI